MTRSRINAGPRGFTLVEVAASVAILGGVIVGLLLARNRALETHAVANQLMACTRLCATQIAALRAGMTGEGQGEFLTPSGTYNWRIAASAPPDDASSDLAAYEVAVWPASPVRDNTTDDSATPALAAPDNAESGASVTLWLPTKSNPAKGTP